MTDDDLQIVIDELIPDTREVQRGRETRREDKDAPGTQGATYRAGSLAQWDLLPHRWAGDCAARRARTLIRVLDGRLATNEATDNHELVRQQKAADFPSKKTTPRCTVCQRGDGWGGIRTLGTLLTYTRFPGVRLKPLGHPSREARDPSSTQRSAQRPRDELG